MAIRSLAPNHVAGVLSPLGNVTTQLEFEVLAPADVFATYCHFDLGEEFADTLKQAGNECLHLQT